MRSVLISIQPPHTGNIFDLVKGIEWRTKPMPTGKYYCYETQNGGGCGKVIGEFTINGIRGYDNANNIPANYIDSGCVPREFLRTYSKGKRIYAHFIVTPKKYDKPRELSEFKTSKEIGGYEEIKRIARPPQSWCYVESEGKE